MFQRFHQVAGFTYSQCLLCFALPYLPLPWRSVFRGFDTFASCIANGEFDRILVRPRGLVFQVICKKVELTRLGKLLQALVIFCYAVPNCGVEWNGIKILGLVLMVLVVQWYCLPVCAVCGYLFFYTGRLGIYECVHRWGKRVRKISSGNLWKAHFGHLYVFGSLCLVSILSVSVPYWSAVGGGIPVPSLLSCLFSIPCYLFGDGGCAIISPLDRDSGIGICQVRNREGIAKIG